MIRKQLFEILKNDWFFGRKIVYIFLIIKLLDKKYIKFILEKYFSFVINLNLLCIFNFFKIFYYIIICI
jgi:hypothetical protein